MKTLLLPLLLTSLLGAPLASEAASLAELERGQLDLQLLETRSRNPYVQARGLLDVPVEKAWQALTAFSDYPRYFQNLTRAETRTRQGNKAQVYVTFDFPFPFNQIWVLNEYQIDAARRQLSWKMLDGNLKNSNGSGSWTLRPYKGKTLATYRLSVSQGGLNDWIQQQAFYQLAPAIFKHLNTQIR